MSETFQNAALAMPHHRYD